MFFFYLFRWKTNKSSQTLVRHLRLDLQSSEHVCDCTIMTNVILNCYLAQFSHVPIVDYAVKCIDTSVLTSQNKIFQMLVFIEIIKTRFLMWLKFDRWIISEMVNLICGKIKKKQQKSSSRDCQVDFDYR